MLQSNGLKEHHMIYDQQTCIFSDAHFTTLVLNSESNVATKS